MSTTMCQVVMILFPQELTKMLIFPYPMAKIDFPNWLQDELNERGWSQSDLARESGIMPASISRILQGTRNPGPEACTAIANALGFPVETIFRVAGLLPERVDIDEETQQMMHLFEQLADDDQEALISLAQFFIERREGKAITRLRPANG